MSTVIIQPRDWPDWYKIRKWLTANAPGGYRLRSAVDSMPAAFEYAQEHQDGLMRHLYPEAYPDPAAPAVEPLAAPAAPTPPVSPDAPAPVRAKAKDPAPAVDGAPDALATGTTPPEGGTPAPVEGDGEPVVAPPTDVAQAADARRKAATGGKTAGGARK